MGGWHGLRATSATCSAGRSARPPAPVTPLDAVRTGTDGLRAGGQIVGQNPASEGLRLLAAASESQRQPW